MKRARLLSWVLVFCMILPYFNFVLATGQEFGLAASDIIQRQGTATSNNPGEITFTVNTSGLYRIDVKSLALNNNRDLYYTLTDSSGKEVRLASYFELSTDEYITITDPEDLDDTTIDVLLKAGQTYKITLSDTSACRGSSEFFGFRPNTYVDLVNKMGYGEAATFQADIYPSPEANKYTYIYQSEISSRIISGPTPNIEDVADVAVNFFVDLWEKGLAIGKSFVDIIMYPENYIQEYGGNPIFESYVCVRGFIDDPNTVVYAVKDLINDDSLRHEALAQVESDVTNYIANAGDYVEMATEQLTETAIEVVEGFAKYQEQLMVTSQYLKNVEASWPEYMYPAGSEITTTININTINTIIMDTVVDGVNAMATLADEYVINPLEQVVCEMMLTIGDYVVYKMNQILGTEVTITGLIYNQYDAVNPNFFDPEVKATGITSTLTQTINKWYNTFKLIALSIYIVALLAIGLNVLLYSTGSGMAKARELIAKWFKGLVCLLFMPYVIKYAFLLNEAIVNMLAKESEVVDYRMYSTFAGAEWSLEETEFRSPKYVSRYTGVITFGSEISTEEYMEHILDYKQTLDLMRIMRAYTGATMKMIYAIIWFVLIGQLLVFLFQYYKRYFIIAFFIATYPIVCIFYGISIMKGEPGREIGSWVKEILTNIFIQTIHAIIYTLITGICLNVIADDMQGGTSLNWIVMILAINFVSEGEKLMRKLLGAIGNSADGTGKSAKEMKGAYGKSKKWLKTVSNGQGE